MSVMSTGQASLRPAVGAEFMAPGSWAEGSASSGTAGRSADGRNGRNGRNGCNCQETAASERGKRDLRITEVYFRELHLREGRSVEQRARQRTIASGRARDLRAREIGAGERVAAARAGERTAPARAAAARPGPVRLTRRGRVVVAVLTVLAAAAVVVLLWLSLAGGAQASSQGQPAGAGYRGMTQVVVRPGQTLWSIASAAEPSADPRIVIQQIIDTNALGGTSIRAGQLLWVPKG